MNRDQKLVKLADEYKACNTRRANLIQGKAMKLIREACGNDHELYEQLVDEWMRLAGVWGE